MIWTQEKDYIMLTAMAGEGVFDSKAGNRTCTIQWFSPLVLALNWP